MNNSLDDLRREYTASAELLTQMISHGNQLMRQARAGGNDRRVRQLRARQQDLYVQRAHILQIEQKLKDYYRRSA